MSQVPERFTFIGLIDDNDVKDLDPFYYEKKSMQEIRKSFGMAEGGGVDERVILSFSFNEDNVNLKDVIDVVKTYSADYYTSGDMSKRSLYVTLRKSKALELKSELKAEFDVYDFEIVKSRYQYAQGGGVEKDANYHQIIQQIENNERILNTTYGSERIESVQKEIERLKSLLRNKYGVNYNSFSEGGGVSGLDDLIRG
jgi:uncharacterized small protein (DUF1192 family)